MARKLTARQQLFVKHYVATKNGAKSARLAGYTLVASAEAARQLLTNSQVRAAVDAGLAKQAEKAEISGDKILKRIAEFAFDKKKIRANDTLKACELLGKHFKLFTEALEHSTKDGEPLVLLTMPRNGREAPPEGSEPVK